MTLDEERQRVVALWREGKNTAEIASALILTEPEVVRIVHWHLDARHFIRTARDS